MKIILVQLLWYILFLSGHAGATPAVSGVEIGELRNGNTKYNSRMEHNTFWLYEGEELNLICLVKNGSFLAQNNTFVFKHEQGVVKELVTDGQAEQFLVIKKVTEKHAGLYSCRLHPGDSLVGRLTVRVSPKPLNCIVYNWDRLTCRWNVTNPPDTRLVWTIVGPFYYECPHHAPNFCEWRVDDNNHLDSFKPYMSYYKMCLVSTNDTRCYYKERVYLNTIVKPDPVPLKDLRLSSPSSRTLEIRGNNTSKHKVNLLYRFHLKGGSVNQTWNSTSLYYHFTGLTPYTRYTLAVTCVPKEQSQYTSEAVHLNLTTLADVPDGPPGVASGGFWQGLCRDNNTRDVIVYLQPIDEALRNAPRIRYNVCASDTEFVFAKEPTWGDNSIQLHLNCDAEYKLKLCGESEVGGSNHGANLTIPPSISKGTYRNFDLIVEEDTDLNVVIMTWPEFARDVQRLSPDVQHFTVYYCKRGHLDMPICKDNIEWIHLPPSNNYTFNLTEDFLRVTGDIMVGLSTDFSQNTTGILWSPCVFMKRADLQKPRGLQLTENEDQNLVVKWNPTECEDRTGVVQHPFVRRYRVVYCEIDSNMYSTQERHPCPASERMKIVSKDTSVELRNVRPGYHYAVAVQAVVEDRDGPWTEWKETQISRTITTGEIAGIVIGSIVVLCFSPYGLLVFIRRIKQKTRDNFVCELPPELDDLNLYPDLSHLPGRLDAEITPVDMAAANSAPVLPPDVLPVKDGYVQMSEHPSTRAKVDAVKQRETALPLDRGQGDKTTGQASVNHNFISPLSLEPVGVKKTFPPRTMAVVPDMNPSDGKDEKTGKCIKTCTETSVITSTLNSQGYVTVNTDNTEPGNFDPNANTGVDSLTSESKTTANTIRKECVRPSFSKPGNSTFANGKCEGNYVTRISDNRATDLYGNYKNVGSDCPRSENETIHHTTKEEYVRASFPESGNSKFDNGMSEGMYVRAISDIRATDLCDSNVNVVIDCSRSVSENPTLDTAMSEGNYTISDSMATDNLGTNIHQVADCSTPENTLRDVTMSEEYVRASFPNPENPTPDTKMTEGNYITAISDSMATDNLGSNIHQVADCSTPENTLRDVTMREEYVRASFPILENPTPDTEMTEGNYIRAISDSMATDLGGFNRFNKVDWATLQNVTTDEMTDGNSENTLTQNGCKSIHIEASTGKAHSELTKAENQSDEKCSIINSENTVNGKSSNEYSDVNFNCTTNDTHTDADANYILTMNGTNAKTDDNYSRTSNIANTHPYVKL